MNVSLAKLMVIFFTLFFAFSSFTSINKSLYLLSLTSLFIVFVAQLRIIKYTPIPLLLLALLVIAFQLFFIATGLLGGADGYYSFRHSQYLLIFLFMPFFYHLIKCGKLNVLISYLSIVVLFKATTVFIYALYLISGAGIVSVFFDNSALLVHRYMGVYRVFDSFVIFFPLAFYTIQKWGLCSRVVSHVIILGYVLFSFSIGVYASYILMLLLLFSIKTMLLLAFLVSFFAYFYVDISVLFEWIVRLYVDKLDTSAGVKMNQLNYLYENVSLLGEGVGKVFNVSGRIDTMFEVLHVYWITIYGVVGALLFYSFSIFFPIIIYYRFNENPEIWYIFVTYMLIMLNSFVNPYALSGVVFMFLGMMISYWYFFTARIRLPSATQAIGMKRDYGNIVTFQFGQRIFRVTV